MENDMNSDKIDIDISNQVLYEKPTLIEIGILREILRGSGSATFDGFTPGSPTSCATSGGVSVDPIDLEFCDWIEKKT